MVEIAIQVHRMARVLVIANPTEPVWLTPAGVEASMAQVARSASAAIPSRFGNKIKAATRQGAGIDSFLAFLPCPALALVNRGRGRPRHLSRFGFLHPRSGYHG